MSRDVPDKKNIAQINPQMPYISMQGITFFTSANLPASIEHEQKLPEIKPAIEMKFYEGIGHTVRHAGEDGATLQLGIGKIPDWLLCTIGYIKSWHSQNEMISRWRYMTFIQKWVIITVLKVSQSR